MMKFYMLQCPSPTPKMIFTISMSTLSFHRDAEGLVAQTNTAVCRVAKQNMMEFSDLCWVYACRWSQQLATFNVNI